MITWHKKGKRARIHVDLINLLEWIANISSIHITMLMQCANMLAIYDHWHSARYCNDIYACFNLECSLSKFIILIDVNFRSNKHTSWLKTFSSGPQAAMASLVWFVLMTDGLFAGHFTTLVYSQLVTSNWPPFVNFTNWKRGDNSMCSCGNSPSTLLH